MESVDKKAASYLVLVQSEKDVRAERKKLGQELVRDVRRTGKNILHGKTHVVGFEERVILNPEEELLKVLLAKHDMLELVAHVTIDYSKLDHVLHHNGNLKPSIREAVEMLLHRKVQYVPRVRKAFTIPKSQMSFAGQRN